MCWPAPVDEPSAARLVLGGDGAADEREGTDGEFDGDGDDEGEGEGESDGGEEEEDGAME